MSKIKVLAFIVSMNNGGAQKVILDNAVNFQHDDDIDFTICSIYKFRHFSNYEKELQKNNIKIKYLTNLFHKLLFRILPSKKRMIISNICKKYIKKINPDIVHVHLNEAMLYVPQAAEKCNVPVRFYSLHSNPYRQEEYIVEAIKKAFTEQNFIALCLNNRQYEQAKEHYNVQKYEILRNGVDFKKIRRNAISKELARKLFGLNESDFVISCVGRLAPVKNYSFMLDIMKLIVEERKNAKLIFAGDGHEREQLYNKAKDLGIIQNVMFLGNLSDVIPVYCASDVFCLTSITEASPLVLLEAQAVNVYCVISAGVPTESIISDKVCQMDSDASAEKWSEAILNESFVGTPVSTEKDCDVSTAIRYLKSFYIKYFRENKK